MTPSVSTLICTWQRQEVLRQTLTSLTELVVPPGITWDVLVVNNDCTTATDSVVGEFAGKLPVRLVREPVVGASSARNRALREATGDLLAFTDDDVMVAPDLLERLLECAARYPLAGVFGGAVEPWFPVAPEPVLAAAFPLLATGFCGTMEMEEGECPPDFIIYGANMAFRRDAAAGLEFDTRLGPQGLRTGGLEETEFIDRVRKRGWAVVWCPAMRVRHYVDPARMTLQYMMRFYTERTRCHFRRIGSVDVPLVFGMPRWALVACFRQLVRRLAARLRGDKMAELEALREYCRAKGAALECRLLVKERRAATSGGGS